MQVAYVGGTATLVKAETEYVIGDDETLSRRTTDGGEVLKLEDSETRELDYAYNYHIEEKPLYEIANEIYNWQDNRHQMLRQKLPNELREQGWRLDKESIEVNVTPTRQILLLAIAFKRASRNNNTVEEQLVNDGLDGRMEPIPVAGLLKSALKHEGEQTEGKTHYSEQELFDSLYELDWFDMEDRRVLRDYDHPTPSDE